MCQVLLELKYPLHSSTHISNNKLSQQVAVSLATVVLISFLSSLPENQQTWKTHHLVQPRTTNQKSYHRINWDYLSGICLKVSALSVICDQPQIIQFFPWKNSHTCLEVSCGNKRPNKWSNAHNQGRKCYHINLFYRPSIQTRAVHNLPQLLVVSTTILFYRGRN